MLKRILRFDHGDWKHIFWLLGRIFVGYWNGNINQMIDAWFWIRFHLEYDSVRVNN